MESIANYNNHGIVHVPLHADPVGSRIVERARKGYYHVIDGGVSSDGIGVDLRGKTDHPTHSYVLSGIVHHLDAKGFAVLGKFLTRRRLTAYAKKLIESGDYEVLAREYGFEQGAFGVSKNPNADLKSALAMMA